MILMHTLTAISTDNEFYYQPFSFASTCKYVQDKIQYSIAYQNQRLCSKLCFLHITKYLVMVNEKYKYKQMTVAIYTQKNKTWTHISFWDIHNICPFLGGPTMFYFCRLFFDLICGLLRPYFKNYACFWSILWREKELCIYF